MKKKLGTVRNLFVIFKRMALASGKLSLYALKSIQACY